MDQVTSCALVGALEIPQLCLANISTKLNFLVPFDVTYLQEWQVRACNMPHWALGMLNCLEQKQYSLLYTFKVPFLALSHHFNPIKMTQ